MILLQVDNLKKAFGSLVVTNNVNLEISAGERHVIIGPNGAGKTSLLHQLTGQIKPTSGRIIFKGVDVTNAAPEAICQLGVGRTFQKNNLFRTLTVGENVRLAVQAKSGGWYQPFKSTKAYTPQFERANQILAQLELSDLANLPVASLSYGAQRQLEVALALASNPTLLLLDEPTSGMSPAETDRMIDLIRGLPKDMAMLIIEHDMKVVFSLADRITVMHYGQVLASGTPEEIQRNVEVREVYLGGKF